MNDTTEKPYTGPTITHQALETLPYRPGEPMTRCWSKWTDGRITHSDTITTSHKTKHGTMYGSMFVNIGADEWLRPPPGLTWIDTVAIRAPLPAGGAS